ncbi:NACHT domain-containing protein [Actinokineospora sp. HUAS TT18]|uniref:NACHT domain-containing protein n=1 Tax=Actinokineospora sp. HUAS TT18 TaxID=3447451 RepID=UPI003F5268CC
MTRVIWWWVSGLAFVCALAGVLLFLATKGSDWLDLGDKVASIGGLLIGLTSLGVAAAALRMAMRPPPEDPTVRLERACEDLASTVTRQWAREARARGLAHPEPLRVRWSSTGRPVGAAADEVLDPGAGRAVRLRLDGDVTTAAAAWQQLPAQQLVVLGAPGAGKTSLAVLLIRQLLAERTPGEPVPVLLNLSGWDPERDHLDTWLARRLAADYPSVADTAVRLVDRGRVIPVLDGLDELAEPARPVAVAALTAAIARDRPLILTCRGDEYEQVIAATGTPLARAAVVELMPITGPEIAKYLTAAQVDGPHRWAPVLDRLRADPTGVLATALSTPLMVYLAHTAYSPPATDPAALIGFTTVDEIEEHLLAVYLPTVYRPRVAESDTSGPSYTADDAGRWLGFIASQLTQARTRNLRLWAFTMATPTVTALKNLISSTSGRVALGAILTLTVWPFFLRGSPPGASLLGLTSFLLLLVYGALWHATLGHAPPRRGPIRPFTAVYRIGVSRTGLIRGFLRGLVTSPVAFTSGYLIDLLVTNTLVPPGYRNWVSSGTALGAVMALLLMGMLVLRFGTGERVWGVAPDPVSALREDRAVFIAAVVGMGLFGAVVLGASGRWSPSAVGFGAAFGLLLGIGVGGIGGAWGAWQLKRAALALYCGLPWRSARFLEDAHRRGVLRVVGTDYQFRHARLQDYLSS